MGYENVTLVFLLLSQGWSGVLVVALLLQEGFRIQFFDWEIKSFNKPVC